MLQLKVKTKDVRFTIPLPYAILHIGIAILSSKFFRRNVNRWTKDYLAEKNWSYMIPPIDKKLLTPFVSELKNNKGLLLVDVKAKDGTEVRVRL
ncbi:hypothetical protein [Bacillus sp. SJS]|uniref:hypothetical protein n=1 Tax=Bacillus sp. SJS TaxID=1423321 RepID=UPI0004DCD83F|nr:hypothetical protein [Bacillus sp. SJS]KZZ85596.1 hypothetical protein AS29_005035 [Bacillus sp. SJS]